MARNIVVGDQGATFNEILLEISRSEVGSILSARWIDLARQLNIPHVEVLKINRNLLMGIQSQLDILDEILINWRSRYASEATLEILCEAFRNIGLVEISDRLLRRFVHDLNAQKQEEIAYAKKPKTEFKVTEKLLESSNTPRFEQATQRIVENISVVSEGKTVDQDASINAQSVASLAQQVGTTNIYYYPGKRRLGQGVTSLVYQGYFGKVETLAAVKEIKKKDTDIFDNELEAFRTLTRDQMRPHPNIVMLFESADYDDWLYFAMEKATCDLRNLIEINPTLNRKTMLKLRTTQ